MNTSRKTLDAHIAQENWNMKQVRKRSSTVLSVGDYVLG